MKKLNYIFVLLLMLVCTPLVAFASDSAHEATTEEGFNTKEIIFDHLGDRYGWEVPFNHHASIPLPIIVLGQDGWNVFSSAKVEHGKTYTDSEGRQFRIAGKESPYKGKVVQIIDGQEVKPRADISITKNVLGILISVVVVICVMLALANWHKKQGLKTPRKGLGAVEQLLQFIYEGVIKSTLGESAPKFAPYLLTVFFFIFTMNLLGLIVIFPGGANLTGNIAVTLVLAVLTFLFTNIFATKHYWKEIFWPDVPLWLKFPLPIMPIIEIFGMFTKPAALTIRLFANMMGGHMIVIVLTMLIFIFFAMAPWAGGAATVVSVLFSIFMILIDVLVSFIQAYVFTMLSTIFIGLAQEKEHEKHEVEAAEAADAKAHK